MTNSDSSDRIHDYLRQLTPQGRGRLLAEMERLRLCGEDVAGSDRVLSELRAELQGNQPGQPGEPFRHFFAPLQPLLIDGPPERANAGQISRGSLTVIWGWINEFLLPTMAREYCKAVESAIAGDNQRGAQQAAASFQTKVVKCLDGLLGNTTGIDQVRESIGVYTSSRASFEELGKMLTVFRAQEALAAFADALPPRIKHFEGKPLEQVQRLLASLQAANAEALPFALMLVAGRLAAQWQLIRLATKAAPSKQAADIAATPLAMAVSMALDCLDDKRIAIRSALKSQRIPIAKDLLIDAYDFEYALRVRIDALDQSDWGKRLAEIMQAVATDLDRELQNIPDNLHHVLGSRALHRHDSLAGRLSHLAWKMRDFLANPGSFKKMLTNGNSSSDTKLSA